jgi:hypothetical protein
VGAFEDAFTWQEKGCAPELNPMNWADRFQNLACYAYKIYEANPRRVEMREKSVEIVRGLHARGDLRLAKDLLGDTDLKGLLAIEPQLAGLLAELAKGSAPSAPPPPPV